MSKPMNGVMPSGAFNMRLNIFSESSAPPLINGVFVHLTHVRNNFPFLFISNSLTLMPKPMPFYGVHPPALHVFLVLIKESPTRGFLLMLDFML